MESRFFCEFCGREVAYNSEVCPSCGAEFKAVRCPICHFEGHPALFNRGCPQCSYTPAGGVVPHKPLTPAVSEEFQKTGSAEKKKKGSGSSLAVYYGVFFFLLGCLIILSVIYYRL